MKNNMTNYQSPAIELQEVLVEKGFAGSAGSSGSSIEGGLGGSENMGGSGDVGIDW